MLCENPIYMCCVTGAVWCPSFVKAGTYHFRPNRRDSLDVLKSCPKGDWPPGKTASIIRDSFTASDTHTKDPNLLKPNG